MQVHPTLLRLALLMFLFLLAAVWGRAQGRHIQARVRSVRGIVRIYAGPGFAAPKVNDPLEPGNRIETGPNGRVVISLTDGGSQITVLPNSRVVLKNFRDAQSARELLEIMLGRVLVKIYHAVGKPNPYNLSSPAASIAVRGTEFIVDVRMGGETLVLVREGLVEVWPRNKPDRKRLVTPGRRVIVRLGGDIGSVFPGPGSELNGRTRLNGDLGESYQRSIDSVARNSFDISPVFYSAFPDSHLDSLENPAFAVEFKNAEGRVLLLPSISNHYTLNVDSNPNMDVESDPKSKDIPPRFDYTLSPQLTFFTPVPGSRLTIGGGASISRTSSQDLIDSTYALDNANSAYYNHQVLRLNASNVSFIAAYSLGAEGKTSVGIGVEKLSGDGNFSMIAFSDNSGVASNYNSQYISDSNARFTSRRLTLGVAHRFSEGENLGLYYRHSFSSSDQENRYNDNYNFTSNPDFFNGFSQDSSFSSVGMTNSSTLSSSSELGVRFRASFSRRLFYGIEGSYLYERIHSRDVMQNQPSLSNNYQYLARRARLGGGLGFALTSKILLAFDLGGGFFNSSQPSEALFSTNGTLLSMAPITAGRGIRGASTSAHAAAQINPWRNFFLSVSNLTAFQTDLYKYNYFNLPYNFVGASDFKNKNLSQLSSGGLGWKFKSNLSLEYLFSLDHSYQLPSHSILLRYTFNLGATNEK
ncbi:MAG: FecR domain-containing protein [Chloracidobacterium sp.]|nr:FecR domain-containing protein [Chloracidobacterium sp.]